MWEAESFSKIFTNGRTMPIEVICFRRAPSDGKKERKEFLLKSIGHPDVTETGLFSEFAGNVLAQHFGIATPDPALVSMSPAFVTSVVSNPEFVRISQGRINLRPGIAVACEIWNGLAPVARDYRAALPHEVAEAARLFVFDMLVQNPDRTRARKTNTAHARGRLIAFDFEMCFSFLFLLGEAPEPWRIDLIMAREHLLFPSLQGKVHEWQGFLDDLADLESDKIEQIFTILLAVFPNCRHSAEKIKRHLVMIRERSSEFKRELDRSLA